MEGQVKLFLRNAFLAGLVGWAIAIPATFAFVHINQVSGADGPAVKLYLALILGFPAGTVAWWAGRALQWVFSD